MAMFLIAGSFRITGAQPDGDSIRFTPDDPAKWDLITGPNRVKRNASGSAQLRLDAIDALETHYGTPRTHQPLELAHAARRAARLAELQQRRWRTRRNVYLEYPRHGSRLYSDALGRSVRAVHCLRGTWRSTRRRWVAVLRGRGRVENHG